jgi:hypothetical protein
MALCWLACLLLGLIIRYDNASSVFTTRGTDFLDADCYTRMERVRHLIEHPWQPLRWHAFENAPEGIRPHTTSLLDYSIAGLSALFRPRFGTNATDLAGAWISPFLGLLSMIFLTWWSRPGLGISGRPAILAAHALMPAVAWAQNIGRPDHQSLILLLVGIGLAMEFHLRAKPDRRDFQIAAGLSWGGALWVSLFEPFLMLLVVVGVGFAQERTRFFLQRRNWWISLLAIFFFGCLVDGWPFHATPPDQWQSLRWWWQGIAELQGMSAKKFFLWFGLWLVAVPFLWVAARQHEKATVDRMLPLLVALVVVAVLSLWQMRWTALLGWLLCVTAVPLLAGLPGRWWQLGVGTVFSIPMIAYASLALTTPPPAQPPHTSLRVIANAMKGPGILLAPWWTSPPLLYFSRNPSVASSSHESLPGNIVSARFFDTTDPDAALALANERKVRWVVVGPAESVLVEAARLLRGVHLSPREIPKQKGFHATMAARLQTSRGVPPWLHLRAVAGNYRLYEITPHPHPEKLP